MIIRTPGYNTVLDVPAAEELLSQWLTVHVLFQQPMLVVSLSRCCRVWIYSPPLISSLCHAQGSNYGIFHRFSWSVLFPGKTGSAFRLPVWSWGSNTLCIVKVSTQQRLPGPHSAIGPSQLPTNPFIPGVCGECHGAGSLHCAGEKYGAQFPLSISSVSPSCPEQLWQCLCLQSEIPAVHKQVSAVLPLDGQGLPRTDSLAVIWMGHSSQSLEVSGAVRGSHRRFCCAAHVSAWPEQGGKGCSLLGWGERCKHREGAQASLPTHTLDIQTHPRAEKPLYFTSLSAALANTPLWSLGLRFDREGWASALPCPEWEVTPTSDPQCPFSVLKSGTSGFWGSHFMCFLLAVLKYYVVYLLI